MHRVEPEIFMVGATDIRPGEIARYLDSVGTKWRPEYNNSGSEVLTELMGRLCYRSFEAGLNPNVTKVRDGNKEYIANIIDVAHGSVLEHSSVNLIFHNVSRVFTHELVRHRAGCAFSQESLRYVRLTDLGLWLPSEIAADPYLMAMFEETFRDLEDLQNKITRHLDLDNEKNFARKKKYTSAMRRIAPIGLATTIGATFNHRAARWILQLRSDSAAEAEIRFVMDKLANILIAAFPHIYADFTRNDEGVWSPSSRKV